MTQGWRGPWWRRALMAGAAALALTGCSTVELAYRNADWLTRRAVQDYVDLTDAQEAWLDARLERHLVWHCRNELPGYVAWLQSAARTAADDEPITPEMLDRRLDEVVAALRRLGLEMAPTAAELFRGLSPRQVQALEARIAERQGELEEKYLSPPPEDRRRARTRRLEERLERWLGPLEEAQRLRVARWSRDLQGQTAAWLASRARWQAELRTALAARSAPVFEQRMTELFAYRERFWSEEYRAHMGEVRALGIRAVADVLALADRRQRRHLSERLEELSRDLRAVDCA